MEAICGVDSARGAGLAAQRLDSHTARRIGIAQPIGGHMGGGAAWHAARNSAIHARLAARCVQAGQQA